jgi:hypothetical protein
MLVRDDRGGMDYRAFHKVLLVPELHVRGYQRLRIGPRAARSHRLRVGGQLHESGEM